MKGMLPDRARFGVFELDLKAGELHKDGQTILLQEQPLQVLRMLVVCAGELVTRDEIQKKLWPNDTVVEFDHGINTAIQKLRQALGDSADKPSYIQTVARRGYRLMTPVEFLESTPDDGPPLLAGREAPEEDEAGLLDDDAPAGAFRGAARRSVGAQHGIEKWAANRGRWNGSSAKHAPPPH